MEEKYAIAIEESVQQVFASMAKRVSAQDMQRIKDAYHLAFEAHSSQKRKSGEPYIIHPIAVARIVAEEIELGANPVIAAFLHDVVEDTPITIDQIRSRFGKDVAFLVSVVTKQKKEKYEESKQVDNYRQILTSLKYDIRALLIKLADRLHNMRTLDSMRPDKQMKIAGETDYFYAPLANRLGMYHIKSELENLSFRYRCPREYAALEHMLLAERDAHIEQFEAFAQKIDEVLRQNGIAARIELRYRRPYNIYRKMQNRGSDIHHIDGKHYYRVIYNTKNAEHEKMRSLHIYAVLSNHFKEKPGSVANYINAPKENGYQSFHVKLLNERGGWEEVHISSERMVRNSRLGCAAERTEEDVSSWLSKFKAVLQEMTYHNAQLDFMDGVTSSFYNDDILVFTPAGKGVMLPKGATALDFAYEIHSQVGLHAVYAQINGKVCSVTTPLRRGDCVAIVTQEGAVPNERWLSHVLTYKAKRNMRNHFATLPTLPYTRCGHCHPLPADEVIGFKEQNGNVTLHKRNCNIAIRQASQFGDSLVSINFEPDNRFLYPVRICIKAVDRSHFLRDIVACITEQLLLSIDRLDTVTVDNLVTCTVDFKVHSVTELQSAAHNILHITGVDEVKQIDIE